MILIRCNPFPTSVEWEVECEGDEDDIGCRRQKLAPGEVDTRFNVSQVEVQVWEMIHIQIWS